MKNTFKPALFVLLMCGVFAADGDKVKTVMEGDSVTLNPDLTQIQGFLEIQWRFKDNKQPIAYTGGREPTYPEDERFRDRLKLNQTGSLTITNMRIKHSGLYHLLIDLNTGPLNVDFTVTVSESPDVILAVKGELKMKSVIEGDSVTLQTDVTELHGDELIVWRSGEEGKLIAKADIETKSSLLYDTDERFRDRLKLENNGSLIISDTRISDSGLYTLKISSSTHTTYKTFTVAVSGSGLSPGAKAGIGVSVVLLVAAAAAAVAGVIYNRCKISELQKQTYPTGTSDKVASLSCVTSGAGNITKLHPVHKLLHHLHHTMCSVPAMEGGYVTLNPFTEIQTGDQIQWMFGDKEFLIAEIKRGTRGMTVYDGPDERFRYRLTLDEVTGSLIIKCITTEHTGNYTLKITRGGETLYNRFNVYIREMNIAVMEGEPVSLKPATEINKDDVIQWLFGNEKQLTRIAKLSVKTGKIVTYDVADGRFKDILNLDERTGSLIIMNTTTAHSGLYKLHIRSYSGDLQQTFIVTVNDSTGERVNESATVEIPLLDEEAPDGENEEERTSLL